MIFAVANSYLLDGNLEDQLTTWGITNKSPTDERRLLKRLEYPFVVEIPELGQSFEGVNLSLAGILVHSEDWVLSGLVLDVLLHLPGCTEAITLTTKAISHTKRAGKRAARLRFMEPDPESLRALSKWMLSRVN